MFLFDSDVFFFTQMEEIPMTSIAIAASCGALALILIVFAVYCSYHHLSYKKNQVTHQHGEQRTFPFPQNVRLPVNEFKNHFNFRKSSGQAP